MIIIRHSKDTMQIYDQIFQGEAIHQMDSFFIWICSLLDVRENMTLLDIATGRGQMVQFARMSGARAFGMDFSFIACKHAEKNTPNNIVNADAQRLPYPDNTFDIATNLGSLEHFDDMNIALKEITRILKPTGYACLVVPNTFGLRWNVQIAWRTGDVDDDGQPLQRYGTRKQWEELLVKNNLCIDRVLGYEHERAFPRIRHDLINYLKHPKRLFSMLLIAPLIPVNMAGQFIFICKVNKSMDSHQPL